MLTEPGDGSSLGLALRVNRHSYQEGPELTSLELGTVNHAHLSISSSSKTGDQGPGREITVKSYSGTSLTSLLPFPCPGYQERLIHNLKAQRRQNGEQAGGGQTLRAAEA